MHFFESELKKILSGSKLLCDQQYIGRQCYGKVSSDVRCRIEFTDCRTADEFNALKATMFNRKGGVIDMALIKFADLFGRKTVDNPTFADGVYLCVWADSQDADWHIYHPKEEDYGLMRETLENYFAVFMDEAMDQAQQPAGMLQMN